MNPPKRIDSYIRVSRVGERGGTDSYGSPKDQRAAIERWAEYKGVQIVAEHLDEDESGGSQERPGLEAAIARALAGETDGIVCYDISRFSRFTEGGLRDLRRLEEAGARLVFATEDLDTATVHGKMLFTILLATHAAALDQHKARWKVTKSRAIAEGRQIGPTPPGYARANGKRGGLVPDPTTGPVVTEAYRLAAGDPTLQSVVAHLRAAIPTKTFTARNKATAERYGVGIGESVTVDATWNPTTVRRLLASPVYLGTAAYGSEVNENAHEALTDLATWTRAQHSPSRKRGPSAEHPLSGDVLCATCEQPMVGSRSGSVKQGNERRMLKCVNKDCPKRASISAEVLETRLLAFLVDVSRWSQEHGGNPSLRESFTGEKPKPVDTRAVSEAESALASAKLRREQWATADLDVDPAQWAARDKALAEAVSEAQDAYDRAVQEAGPVEPVPEWQEIAAAGVAGVGPFVRQLGMEVVVQPGRGWTPERVRLRNRRN